LGFKKALKKGDFGIFKNRLGVTLWKIDSLGAFSVACKRPKVLRWGRFSNNAVNQMRGYR
jgi:hypothetical protein